MDAASSSNNIIYWVIPGKLAGMPMPWFDARRLETAGAAVEAFDDDLRLIHDAGLRAVVSMLEMSPYIPVMENSGLRHLSLPVPDGFPPSAAQARDFVRFTDEQLEAGRPVVAHCAAGLGRTGTILAAYLIARGATVLEAIDQVRQAQPAAIETMAQIDFLEEWEQLCRNDNSAGAP